MPYTDDEINNMQDLVKFDFNEFGNTDEVDTMSDTDFSYKVTLKVTEETYEKWKELKSRMNDILGYDNESKVFEFAVIECLNIPEECLKV